MKFGTNVPGVNMHQLSESDFGYDIISQKASNLPRVKSLYR